MKNPKLIQGPRGLNILLIDNPNSLSTSMLILVGVGSDWENKKNNGIFHFIEHLYFKGTKNYPSPKILMEAIDDLGGVYNAFTSFEYTGYYIKVLPEYMFKALQILTDIILNPLFPEEEIEKERKVIIEEINLYQDSPVQLVLDVGNRLTFGDQPAGWSILGTKETISSIKRQEILKSIKKYYSSKNTLIVISGKIHSFKNIVNFIFEKFKNYNSVSPQEKPKFKEPKNEYRFKIVKKEVEQAHIFLGFPLAGFKKLKDKRFVYSILSMILGEKSSSRLWLKIREEMGAAYYVRSNFVDYSDRSLFFIQAGITIDRLGEVLAEIVKEINLLKKEGPDIKELETSKAVLKSNLLMDIEESLGIAIFYGRHFLTEKKILTPKEIEKKINSIKIEDLKEELKTIFLYPQLKFAAILPNKINFNFSKIFKQMLK